MTTNGGVQVWLHALLTVAINGDIAPEKEQTLPIAGPTTTATQYSVPLLVVEH